MDDVNKGLSTGGIVSTSGIRTIGEDCEELIIPLSQLGNEMVNRMSTIYGLAPAVSIKDRLAAALRDEYPYQVVYYNRCEGATTAIQKLVKQRPSIMVAGVLGHRDSYLRAGVPYKEYQHLHRTSINLRDIEAVILDVVPENALRDLREIILSRWGRKLIVVKCIN
ncbi:hypothetical protein ACM1RC_26095 [Paenibacillus azoreducens]|uniref:hypothetical protein n=1 Tax=Paenibacillus azoreducens TaxID=116718 RepID=UPI0039F5B42E